MTWPDEVITTRVTWGSALQAAGDGVKGSCEVTPVFVGTDYIVWALGGLPFMPFPITKAIDDGAFDLPVVDQNGWKDSGGHPYTGWAYDCRVRYESGNKSLEFTRRIQPIIGQDEIDLDLTFDDAVGSPIVGAAVYIVDYQTLGFVVRRWLGSSWEPIALPVGFTGIVFWISKGFANVPEPPEQRDIDIWFGENA